MLSDDLMPRLFVQWLQGFDWEAAAAAMENISLFEDRPRNQGNGNILKENQNRSGKGAKLGVGVPPLANAKLHQKTLLSFVQRSNQKPSSIEKSNQQPINNSAPFVDDIAHTDGPCIDLEAAKTWVYPGSKTLFNFKWMLQLLTHEFVHHKIYLFPLLTPNLISITCSHIYLGF